MPPTKLNPTQVQDLEDLIKRIAHLETENYAHRCMFKGLLVRDLGASIGVGAHKEADKLSEPTKTEVKKAIDEIMRRDT